MLSISLLTSLCAIDNYNLGGQLIMQADSFEFETAFILSYTQKRLESMKTDCK